MSEPKSPFVRDTQLDKPGIVGARWWQQALVDADLATNRRTALKVIAVAAGAVGGIGLLGGFLSSLADDDYQYDRRSLLEMQRRFGWSFGAADVALVFDGDTKQPFDPAAIDRLPADLTPERYLALHVPTLLEAPPAVPKERPAEETAPFAKLRDVLRPISTPAMDRAYAAGAALASLFKGRSPKAAVMVDLAGPETVAFAAGAAAQLDPVLLVDNWPHPQGVVPSHLVLAAAAYYQPLFARRRGERPALAPPLFLLDRNRLAPYRDEPNRFDNRYLARVPPAAALKAVGIEQLFYVIPSISALPELDDLNEAFVALNANKVHVQALPADLFSPVHAGGPATGTPEFLYGGSALTHARFWEDHVAGTGAYQPVQRPSGFAGGRPSDLGLVAVVLAAGTAGVLGARHDRRGSWNRSSGGFGG